MTQLIPFTIPIADFLAQLSMWYGGWRAPEDRWCNVPGPLFTHVLDWFCKGRAELKALRLAEVASKELRKHAYPIFCLLFVLYTPNYICVPPLSFRLLQATKNCKSRWYKKYKNIIWALMALYHDACDWKVHLRESHIQYIKIIRSIMLIILLHDDEAHLKMHLFRIMPILKLNPNKIPNEELTQE